MTLACKDTSTFSIWFYLLAILQYEVFFSRGLRPGNLQVVMKLCPLKHSKTVFFFSTADALVVPAV